MFKYIYTKHFMSKEIEEGGGEVDAHEGRRRNPKFKSAG